LEFKQLIEAERFFNHLSVFFNRFEMLFEKVVETFELVEKTTSRIEMTEILARLFLSAEKGEIGKIVYLCQGQLGPAFKQLECGMGESFVVQAISKITGYGKEKVEALYKEKGDLGLVAFELVQKKKQKSLFAEQLTLEKVFSNFLKIAKAEGPGSQESKKRLLAELLNSASSLEAKFIVRIPLGALRLGAGDPTIMDALAENHLEEFKKKNPHIVDELALKYEDEELHRQLRSKLRERIEEKYNIHSDLGFIAEKLKEKGLLALKEIEITPGIPIRPTLAERLPSAKEIIKKLGRCAVEQKIDGFRMQVHKDGERVMVFSRRMEDMTEMFPEIVKAVKKQIKAKTAIVEGEAVAFNEESEQFYPFQVTIQRKRKYGVSEFSKRFPLKLFLFDVMFLNGKNLMNLPFFERRKTLAELVSKGTDIMLTKQIITNKEEELKRFFDESVAAGLEGIIAKDLNAKYIAGARKFAWIKLKRSYKGELSDSIDAVIIGYYKGKGQRTKFGLGTLLVAVYNDELDRFESVAKIGTGMTEKQLEKLEKILSKTKTPTKPVRVESGLEPDVWVMPEYVIEVRADEITKSPVHACARGELGEGLALRFPRMIQLRSDRSAEQATTVREIVKMFEQQRKISTEEKQ